MAHFSFGIETYKKYSYNLLIDVGVPEWSNGLVSYLIK